MWRERATFIINAQMEEPHRREQLWARQLEDQIFEICCIPLFVYNLALGDLVETDSTHLVTRILRPSGRYVFHVWFGETVTPRKPIADALAEGGALLEWGTGNLLAVDAADEQQAARLGRYLQQQEEGGHLIYQTGKT